MVYDECCRLRDERNQKMSHQLVASSGGEQAKTLVRTTQELQEEEDLVDAMRSELNQMRELIETSKADHMCGGCIGCILGLAFGFAIASLVIKIVDGGGVDD